VTAEDHVRATNVLSIGVLAGALWLATAVDAQESNPARRLPPDLGDGASRVLVKLRDVAAKGSSTTQAAADKVAALAARSRVALRSHRALGASLEVLELDPREPPEAQLQRLRADAAVEYVELDRRRFVHALPNDPLYAQQWYQQPDSVATPSAIDAEHAWDATSGVTGVVIAVLDTGVRFDHGDLGRAEAGGRLLPGYDFVANATTANDGDGRDADSSDPGDFVTQADLGTATFQNCEAVDSSWHGTRVAGIVGARTNNSAGMAGTTWAPWVLPVRVLGKCGGFDSDILAAMLWAAGVRVNGVPDNPYPARVVNLSLGSIDACSLAYIDVIAEIGARGTLVVASAGNEGGPVGSPANCPGVVGVGGLRHAGTKVGYSSLGPEVALSAPAGNCVNLQGACLFPISTTTNFGTTVPGANGYTDQINRNVGTSFSAPIVAAIAGLMASVNGNLTPAQLRARLIEGATTPFPVSSDPTVPVCHVPTGPGDLQGLECNCTTSTCGAGMANAARAVAAAQRPIAALVVPASVSPGQNVLLSAAGSAAACNRAVASFNWAVVAGAGVITGNPTPDSAVVVAPAAGSFTVRVTVTDDRGRTDTADALVTATAATTGAPASAGTTACLADIVVPSVAVTVSPAVTSLQAGASVAFSASVSNTQDTTVTWQVDGIAGGNTTVGTISAAGFYTAPAQVAAVMTVTVTAAWTGDASRTGGAQVTITPLPAPPASSGGGGGSLAWLEVLALLAALLGRPFWPMRRSWCDPFPSLARLTLAG
jgi:serine protease